MLARARWPLTGRAAATDSRPRGFPLLAFLGIAALVIVTPGPDTALTIRNTLGGGRPGGVGTALGVAAGQAVWTVATSAGIAALLVASAPAFAALRLVGRGLSRVARRVTRCGPRPARIAVEARGRRSPGHGGPSRSTWTAFRQGSLSNLGNPKMAVFFTSLLPQFAPAGHASFASAPRPRPPVLRHDARLAGRSTPPSSRERATSSAVSACAVRIEAVTGLALLALGARLALERR